MVWRNQGNCAGRWLELWRCLGFLSISQSGKVWSGRGRCDILSIPHTTTQKVVFPASYLSSPPLCILAFSFISFFHMLTFGFFFFFYFRVISYESLTDLFSKPSRLHGVLNLFYVILLFISTNL